VLSHYCIVEPTIQFASNPGNLHSATCRGIQPSTFCNFISIPSLSSSMLVQLSEFLKYRTPLTPPPQLTHHPNKSLCPFIAASSFGRTFKDRRSVARTGITVRCTSDRASRCTHCHICTWACRGSSPELAVWSPLAGFARLQQGRRMLAIANTVATNTDRHWYCRRRT
jgi:hypothetical protein